MANKQTQPGLREPSKNYIDSPKSPLLPQVEYHSPLHGVSDTLGQTEKFLDNYSKIKYDEFQAGLQNMELQQFHEMEDATDPCQLQEINKKYEKAYDSQYKDDYWGKSYYNSRFYQGWKKSHQVNQEKMYLKMQHKFTTVQTDKTLNQLSNTIALANTPQEVESLLQNGSYVVNSLEHLAPEQRYEFMKKFYNNSVGKLYSSDPNKAVAWLDYAGNRYDQYGLDNQEVRTKANNYNIAQEKQKIYLENLEKKRIKDEEDSAINGLMADYYSGNSDEASILKTASEISPRVYTSVFEKINKKNKPMTFEEVKALDLSRRGIRPKNFDQLPTKTQNEINKNLYSADTKQESKEEKAREKQEKKDLEQNTAKALIELNRSNNLEETYNSFSPEVQPKVVNEYTSLVKEKKKEDKGLSEEQKKKKVEEKFEFFKNHAEQLTNKSFENMVGYFSPEQIKELRKAKSDYDTKQQTIAKEKEETEFKANIADKELSISQSNKPLDIYMDLSDKEKPELIDDVKSRIKEIQTSDDKVAQEELKKDTEAKFQKLLNEPYSYTYKDLERFAEVFDETQLEKLRTKLDTYNKNMKETQQRELNLGIAKAAVKGDYINPSVVEDMDGNPVDNLQKINNINKVISDFKYNEELSNFTNKAINGGYDVRSSVQEISARTGVSQDKVLQDLNGIVNQIKTSNASPNTKKLNSFWGSVGDTLYEKKAYNSALKAILYENKIMTDEEMFNLIQSYKPSLEDMYKYYADNGYANGFLNVFNKKYDNQGKGDNPKITAQDVINYNTVFDKAVDDNLLTKKEISDNTAKYMEMADYITKEYEKKDSTALGYMIQKMKERNVVDLDKIFNFFSQNKIDANKKINGYWLFGNKNETIMTAIDEYINQILPTGNAEFVLNEENKLVEVGEK